jgi:hypothetical protein
MSQGLQDGYYEGKNGYPRQTPFAVFKQWTVNKFIHYLLSIISNHCQGEILGKQKYDQNSGIEEFRSADYTD